MPAPSPVRALPPAPSARTEEACLRDLYAAVAALPGVRPVAGGVRISQGSCPADHDEVVVDRRGSLRCEECAQAFGPDVWLALPGWQWLLGADVAAGFLSDLLVAPAAKVVPIPRKFLRGDHPELCDALLASLVPRRDEVVYDQGALYAYDRDGTWQHHSRAELSRLVMAFAGATVAGSTKGIRLRASDVYGAVALAQDRAAAPGFFADSQGVAFANGFVRTTAEGVSLVPPSPLHRARWRYPFAYTSGAAAPRWLRFLDEVLGDDRESKTAFVQEFGGACLLGIAPRYEQVLVAIGEGANGKSTLIQVLGAAMPPGTTVAVPPQAWGHEFQRALLAGKHYNAVSELPEADILASETFKAMISGDAMTARRIRQEPFTFHPTAGHIFAANRLPGTNDLSHGFWRRIVVVEFQRVLAPGEQESGLAGQIVRAELPGIVSWLLDGAVRLLGRGRLVPPDSHEALVAEWRRRADQVAQFFGEQTRATDDEKEWLDASMLYAVYREWALANGHRPVASNKFGERAKALGHAPVHRRQGSYYPVTTRPQESAIR